MSIYVLASFVAVALGLGFGMAGCTKKRAAPEPTLYQQITGDQSLPVRAQWDQLFDTNVYVFGKAPAKFLTEVIEKIPAGRALDIAMGEGRNAVYLAQKGFQVDGVDISEVALRKARRLAIENKVLSSVKTINADLNHYQIKPGHYDLIVNINYLQRSLTGAIKKGLKNGGYLVFENPTTETLKNPEGKSIPREYLLEPGELKRLFSDLEILIYRETSDGEVSKASLLARKPE